MLVDSIVCQYFFPVLAIPECVSSSLRPARRFDCMYLLNLFFLELILDLWVFRYTYAHGIGFDLPKVCSMFF